MINLDEVFQKKYRTPVLPVSIASSSKGFSEKSVVALFPENHIDKLHLNSDYIFYFINKFVDRFFKITRKMIVNFVEGNTFESVYTASKSEIQYASACWVRMHEYYHRTGHLPLQKYLKLKSFKPLAGLEELRVDINSILTCLSDSDIPNYKSKFISEFILAERLLRYSIEGIPNPNYDAIASQMLFNYLVEHKGIIIRGVKIHISSNIYDILHKFLDRLNKIEGGIQSKSVEKVREDLLRFVFSYTNYNSITRKFDHIGYFKHAKEILSL